MEILGQTPVQTILFIVIYTITGVVPLMAALYLLLRRGNAFAPGITPPMRLRRWTASFFAVTTLAHVWWLLFYIYSGDPHSVGYLTAIVLDYVTLLPSIVGTLLAMLQDRRRAVWPAFVAMIPIVAIGGVLMTGPNERLAQIGVAYIVLLYVLFTAYVTFAVRQYGRWLRDNYADLEHKEVWFTCMLSLVFILLLIFYAIVGTNTTLTCILHVIELVLFGLLLWRVETLPTLEDMPEEAASGELAKERLSDDDPSEKAAEAVDVPKSPSANPINIDVDQMEQLLKEHCVAAQLYLETELTLQMLAQAVGTNRSYLSQYFSRQGITYNTYINNLRVNHFISRSRELAAAGQDVPIQQLALESGFGSYRNFSRAFLLRTGQSVTAWINRGGNI
jgi:AraC-like DNA-binding protein